jgi:hypothetical protein
MALTLSTKPQIFLKNYGGYSFLVSKGQKKHIGKFKNMMVWLV